MMLPEYLSLSITLKAHPSSEAPCLVGKDHPREPANHVRSPRVQFHVLVSFIFVSSPVVRQFRTQLETLFCEWTCFSSLLTKCQSGRGETIWSDSDLPLHSSGFWKQRAYEGLENLSDLPASLWQPLSMQPSTCCDRSIYMILSGQSLDHLHKA